MVLRKRHEVVEIGRAKKDGRKIDAFTAMGASIRLVWNNLPVMIVWGAIVVALTALGLLTATAGLIVVFPLLGHAAWHAYEAVGRPQTGLDG